MRRTAILATVFAAIGAAAATFLILKPWQPPAPAVVYLKENIRYGEIQRVLDRVVARWDSSGNALAFVDGISAVEASGHDDGRATLTLRFSRFARARFRDSLVEALESSPLIERIVSETPPEHQ